jgi:hypothetical protein
MARNAANVLVNLAAGVQLGTGAKLSGSDMVNGIVKNAAMSLKSGSTSSKKNAPQRETAFAMSVAILCGIAPSVDAIMKTTGKLNGAILWNLYRKENTGDNYGYSNKN